MEENKGDFQKLEEYMNKIKESMKLSNSKKAEIEQLNKKLYEETRIMMVDQEKAELENKKSEKKEFDEMTTQALINAQKDIIALREKLEKDYTKMLLDMQKQEKEVEEKFVKMMQREPTDEKVNWINQSKEKALEALRTKRENSQKEHNEKMVDIKNWENEIQSYAIELNVLDKIDNVRTSSKTEQKKEDSTQEIPRKEKEDQSIAQAQTQATTEPVQTAQAQEQTETEKEQESTQEIQDQDEVISSEKGKNINIKFRPYEKNGEGIKEIICQTKLGLYIIEKADGTIEYFDAKREGAVDRKSNKELSKEFSKIDKSDLKKVDLNVLKILKDNGVDNKGLMEYIEGKNDETKFRTIYKNDMSLGEYKKILKTEERSDIDSDTKLKKLRLSQRNFFKKLTRKQTDRPDTYVLFNNKTFIQRISQFFDRKALLDSGVKVTDEELEKISPELKDERLLKEARTEEINKSINDRLYSEDAVAYNELKENESAEQQIDDMDEEKMKTAREEFANSMKLDTWQTVKNTTNAKLKGLVDKAIKEAGVEAKEDKKETTQEQGQEDEGR